MSNWQPISTAPKDGTVVRVVHEPSKPGSFMGAVPAKFIDGKWCFWITTRFAPFDPQPTHWMPLPPPPEDT